MNLKNIIGTLIVGSALGCADVKVVDKTQYNPEITGCWDFYDYNKDSTYDLAVKSDCKIPEETGSISYGGSSAQRSYDRLKELCQSGRATCGRGLFSEISARDLRQ